MESENEPDISGCFFEAVRLGRTTGLCMGLVAATLCGPVMAADLAPQVPFVAGLTTTLVVSEGNGDYETIAVVDRIDAAGYRLSLSGETPDGAEGLHEFRKSRNILQVDAQSSHTLRRTFYPSDPEEFPGTTPEFSAAMLDELNLTGHTTLKYEDVQASLFGSESQELVGTLTRVGGGPVDVPVLVNGRMTPLRALHVSGHLASASDATEGADVDFYVLDDRRHPLRLRSKGPDFNSSVLKIDFPAPPADASSLEHSLTEGRSAVVYGIYFKFARADLRPESDRTLAEIAAVLRAHPDWRLSIVGHTDRIGGDAANLDLSKRRADSVRDALTGRFKVALDRLVTNGYGASQPQATNDTPEGRAKNRRVELVRQ